MLLNLIERDTECVRNTFAIRLVGLETVPDVADLDEFRCIAHGTGGIPAEHLLLFFAHQPEELARLYFVMPVVTVNFL